MVVSFLLPPAEASAETRTVVVVAAEEARENRIDEDLDVDAFMDEETEFNGLNESEVCCCCAMENMVLRRWFFCCSLTFCFWREGVLSRSDGCARANVLWINDDVLVFYPFQFRVTLFESKP